MKKLGILFIALVGFAASSYAQSSASATATSTATIVKPLALTNNRDLAFGRIAVTATGTGNVTIAAVDAGTRAVGGGSTGITLANGLASSSASFTVTGEGNTSYSLTFPGTATLSDGTHNMTATLALDAAHGASNTLAAGGTEDFYIGGSLAISAGQASGDYTGTFNVTIAYN
ncbi:MAG: DUF4402 domain-containing protein [Marinilabiliales bacterium]|nr:DUF4402 domain-containing protein [Marinilabiliales bacterium]